MSERLTSYGAGSSCWRRWSKQSEPTLRTRFRHLPDVYSPQLWNHQREAIAAIEASLADDCPRALLQMATGSGKTFTTANLAYRLIKHAGARRILFLVDRRHLRQLLRALSAVTSSAALRFADARLHVAVAELTRSSSDSVDSS